LWVILLSILFYSHIISAADDKFRAEKVGDDHICFQSFSGDLTIEINKALSAKINYTPHVSRFIFSSLQDKNLIVEVIFNQDVSIAVKEKIYKIIFNTAKDFINRRLKTATKKPPYGIERVRVREHKIEKSDTAISLGALVNFSINLYKQSGWSKQKWIETTNTKNTNDESEKIRILKKIFIQTVFSDGLAIIFPKFKEVNSDLSLYTMFHKLYIELAEKFNVSKLKFDKQEAKILKRLKAIKIKNLHEFNSIEYIKEMSKGKPHTAWKKVRYRMQLAEDFARNGKSMLRTVCALKLHMQEYMKYHFMMENIFAGISDEDQKKFVSQAYVPKEGWAELSRNVRDAAEKIETQLNVAMNHVATMDKMSAYWNHALLGIVLEEGTQNIRFCTSNERAISSPQTKNCSFEESSELFIGEQEIATTKELQQEAKMKIAAEDARRKKKAKRANTSTRELEQDKQIISDELEVFYKNKAPMKIKAERFIPNSKIFIAHELLERDSDLKIEAFLETAERSKIITANSLGQNGIKIYGDFLIIKNKKFPGEHLIYVLHPIDKGGSGYIYLPRDIINHASYETLLEDDSRCEEMLNNVRKNYKIISA
jgi:hypothetical protein